MSSWLALRSALHSLHLDDSAWVDALHAEARGLFDEGLGTFVYSYRTLSGPRIELRALALSPDSIALWEDLATWGAENQRTLAPIYQTGPGTFGEAARLALTRGVPLTDPRPLLELHGVADVFTLAGHDAGGEGLFVTVPVAHRPTLRARGRRELMRFCSEIVALTRLRSQRSRRERVRLSASEQLVAEQLVRGASDKSIAAELGVSLSTVSTFARRVREKLGCQGGEEALLLASDAAPLHRRLALFERLSAAECDVASQLLLGRAHAEIAEERGASPRTVAAQCASVFRKCGVSGRRELAAVLVGP